jgi:hypothetical protein
MGASDWASRTASQLIEEFDISEKRAFRITSLVRLFVSNPEYDDVFAEPRNDKWQRQKTDFITGLTETLKQQPGDTIEERWNNLIDEESIQHRTVNPVYLRPWPEVKNKDPHTTPRFVTDRRE